MPAKQDLKPQPEHCGKIQNTGKVAAAAFVHVCTTRTAALSHYQLARLEAMSFIVETSCLFIDTMWE